MGSKYERLRIREAEQAMEADACLQEIERIARDAREALHRLQAIHAQLGLTVVVRQIEPRRPAA